MLVASVDTSTLTLSLALCDIEQGRVRLLADGLERAPAKVGPKGSTVGHGGRLPGALLELLEAQGRQIAEVEGYAVGLGPGSFTGLRIGLSTFKGLAYARKRPIAGASSLAALALAHAPAAGDGALLVPLLDAKKQEVYAGFYRVRGEALVLAFPEAALSPTDLARQLAALSQQGERVFLVGEGRSACGEFLSGIPALEAPFGTPRALFVAELCAPSLERVPYDAAGLYALEPHYVRASEAELKFPWGLPPHPPNPR